MEDLVQKVPELAENGGGGNWEPKEPGTTGLGKIGVKVPTGNPGNQYLAPRSGAKFFTNLCLEVCSRMHFKTF